MPSCLSACMYVFTTNVGGFQMFHGLGYGGPKILQKYPLVVCIELCPNIPRSPAQKARGLDSFFGMAQVFKVQYLQ